MREPLSEQLLREYLLGTATEAQQELVEQTYLTNASEEERLALAEEELIDDYLDGSLGPIAREHFEQHFLVPSERKLNFAIARGLMNSSRREAPHLEARPWWQSVRTLPLTQGAMVALLVVLAATSTILYRQNVQLRDNLITNARSSSAQTAGAVSPQVPSPNASTPIPLLPTLTRELEATVQVRVPVEASTVEFSLPVTGQRYSEYRVLLRTAEGEELWSRSRLAASALSVGADVKVSVPASLLGPGDYQFVLYGIRRDHRRETLASFNFHIPIH